MVFGEKASGFASPAQGYEEQRIDLNRVLVKNPSATYFFRLDSADMERFGLLHGALLVVDRSLTPDCLRKKRITRLPERLNHVEADKLSGDYIGGGQIVIIRCEGEFLCRLITKKNGRIIFTNGVTDIVPSADAMTESIEIIGTVTSCINIFDNHDFSY